MLKHFLCLAMLAVGTIAYGQEPSLAQFGLSELRPVSDNAGMKVRGSASRAYSMSVASVSALLYDPETGSQVNIDLAHFSNTTAEGAVNEPSTAASEGVLGLTGMTIAVGNRTFQIGPAAVFVGGQSAANGAFGVLNLNVPRFNN